MVSQSFLSHEFPILNKNIIIGRSFQNIDEIKKYTDKNTRIIYYPDAEKMREIMLESDIAITAAGQTVYELIRVGAPFIAIQVTDNQLYITKGLVKHKLVDKIIDWNAPDFKEELLEQMGKINKFENRLRLNEEDCSFIDGLGAKRIVSELLKDVKTCDI